MHPLHVSNSWREDPEISSLRFFKNKAFVNFRMKWVVLPFSESYSEETKCIEVKNYPFSCNEEYY